MSVDYNQAAARVERIIDSLLDGKTPMPGHLDSSECLMVADIQASPLGAFKGRRLLRRYRDAMSQRITAGERVQLFSEFAKARMREGRLEENGRRRCSPTPVAAPSCRTSMTKRP